RAVGRDDVDRAANELRRRLGEPLGHAVAIRIVEGDALAFEVAELAQGMAEDIPLGRVVDDADAGELRRLLRAPRARRKNGRHGGRAGEEGDELTTLHSINSLAGAGRAQARNTCLGAVFAHASAVPTRAPLVAPRGGRRARAHVAAVDSATAGAICPRGKTESS